MKLEIIRELFEFLMKKKKYWVIPVIIIMLLIAVLMILTEGSALAPFIYPLF